VRWDEFLACLFSYSKIKGTLNVQWDFWSPDEDPWPVPLRGMPLGAWVNAVRDQRAKLETHYEERKRYLDLMGFSWLPAVFAAPPPTFDDRLPPCLRLTNEELVVAKKPKRRKAAPKKPKLVRPAYPADGEVVADYARYTVVSLKQMLRDRKLPISGRRKADYIERLKEADDAKAAKAEEAGDDDEGEEEEDDDAKEEEEEDDDDDDDDDDEAADDAEEEIDALKALNEALGSQDEEPNPSS